MHNLFGDRFLSLFAGNLQRRLKRTKPNLNNQNPEAAAKGAAEPINPASEKGDEKNLTAGNQLPNEEEQYKQ